jgi:dTDP-4-amino-4,6-dideoxygalactose transaminase
LIYAGGDRLYLRATREQFEDFKFKAATRYQPANSLKRSERLMHIPLIKPDLPSLEDVRAPFEEILGTGKVTNFGKYVREFEAEAGDYLGAQTAALSSGTVGLVFALAALDLKQGEKVVIPSFTFVATAQAVLHAGGIPLFAEIENDFNISLGDVERLLTENPDVGAVIAVHMYGLPAQAHELEEIVAAASRRRHRRIALVFDAAHAFGSAIDGEKVGGFGDAEVFSLSVTKLLVTAEGGLISTRDPEVIRRVRSMRNYGIAADYNAEFPGLNGKMSEFHAVLGLYNLRRLDALLRERQEKARSYRHNIASTTRFRPTPWPQAAVHTFKDFTILVPDSAGAAARDAVMRHLADAGIETRAYFHPPVHEQTYFRQFATRPLSNTERLSQRVVTLPFFTTITDDEIDYVVRALQQADRLIA